MRKEALFLLAVSCLLLWPLLKHLALIHVVNANGLRTKHPERAVTTPVPNESRRDEAYKQSKAGPATYGKVKTENKATMTR